MSTIDSTFERLDSLSLLIERIHRHAQRLYKNPSPACGRGAGVRVSFQRVSSREAV